MPYNIDAAGELDRVDRILLGACAAIWLAALGAAVAAVVALVDLGRGHLESSGESETPWLLYTIIGVSAAVIIGAVPLLLRARRTALADSQPPARAGVRAAPGQAQPPPVPGTEAPTQKLRVLGTAAEPVNPRPGYPVQRPASTAATGPFVTVVDQLWLRCAVVIACAIGIATVAIGVATYLMAVDSFGAAWVFYGLAGVITLGMPAVPWFYLRELRAVVA
jgi:hypothetical protein